jgi:hypothetical protein
MLVFIAEKGGKSEFSPPVALSGGPKSGDASASNYLLKKVDDDARRQEFGCISTVFDSVTKD